ncbi:MAG TPA: EutN/CcmL family microcompartment protein [Rhodothermales bacterium]|nr:EutN/CcmL family microcompartment protein [Rhodothermales bacterium]
MLLCKVTGTVVATRKQEAFRPAKLLVVHRVDAEGNLEGEQDMLALDPRYGAGVGDYVLVAKEGAVVAQLMETDGVSANVIIIGVVDDWTYEV